MAQGLAPCWADETLGLTGLSPARLVWSPLHRRRRAPESAGSWVEVLGSANAWLLSNEVEREETWQ